MGRARVWTPAQTAGQVMFDFWPCRRPLTKTWGSDSVLNKIQSKFGPIDVAFGSTDGIPPSLLITVVDRNTGYEWAQLPFKDQEFTFGYWDPPYDKMYRPEAREIWRTCQALAILHTHVYPRSWFENAARVGMVAITMGPLKSIRVLNVFRRQAVPS